MKKLRFSLFMLFGCAVSGFTAIMDWTSRKDKDAEKEIRTEIIDLASREGKEKLKQLEEEVPEETQFVYVTPLLSLTFIPR